MKIQKLTSTQKATASFAVILIALMGLYLTLPSDKSLGSLETSINTQDSVQTQPTSLVSEVTHQVATLAAKQNTPSNESRGSAQVASQSRPADFESWKIGGAKAATPSIPLNDQVAKYTIIEIEQHPNQKPSVGQIVEIPMFDGETLRVDVQSVSENPNGDYTWSGHLQGSGNDYPVVMTYGENAIFATVTTPKGSYTMESVNGSGWLYKNPSEFELSKPGTKDYLDVDTSK